MQQVLFERIRVHRSVGDCFAYLRDFSNIEQWDPSVYRAEKCTATNTSANNYRLTFNSPSSAVATKKADCMR